MNKVFISVKRELAHSPETINTIKKWEKKGLVNVFVQKYSFKKGQEKEMMKKALDEISNCDIFVATGTISIGVGIEVGIAYALGKKIYIEMEETSATLKGVMNNVG